MNIIQKTTPNFTEGRYNNKVEKIVVHWIVGRLEAADATFAKASSQVSAHYGVGDNEVHQYVREEDTAWHCGDWLWNLKTIGIEHEGGPSLPISDATYETSAALIKDICTRHNIPIDKQHILPHHHFVATQCSGSLDIDRLIALATKDSNPCKEIEEDRDYQRKEKEKYKEEARNSRELIDKYQDEIKQKTETISKQQEQISLLNEQLTNNTKEISDLRLENKSLREHSTTLQGLNNELVEINNGLISDLGKEQAAHEKTKGKLKTKLNKLPRWELLKAVIFR